MKGKRGMWLLAAALLVVSACAEQRLLPEESSAPAEHGEASERTVVEFWHTYSDLETEVFETEVLPKFEETHPDILVRAVRKDYTEQLKDNTLAAAAENEQPDVMRMDIVWVPDFARRGVIVDLTERYAAAGLRDRFIGQLAETAVYRGKTYGLPVNANTKAAIFNRTLLAEAGLAAPPTTFSELVQGIRTIRKTRPDVYGIGICCSSAWGTLPYFWTLGGELTDPAYETTTGYLDHPRSVAALGTIKRWFDEGVISPSVVGGEPGNWDGILKGNLFMIDEAHWFYTVNRTGANAMWLDETIPAPFPDGVRPGTSIIGGENLVLFRGADHPEAAWTFMEWMISDEPQRIMATTGLIPTIVDIQGYAPDSEFEPYLQQLDHARPRPPVPQWTDIDDVFARMIEKILSEELTIERAVDEAGREMNRLLRDGNG